EKCGYLLARGDKRSYVVVDRFGEIHALARQIEGARTKDVKARLADYPADKLPDAKKAQEFARMQREAQKVNLPDFKQQAEERRARLKANQDKRRAVVDEKQKALENQHRIEREPLLDAQDAENKGIASERLRSQHKGIIAFLARITGIRALSDYRSRRQD